MRIVQEVPFDNVPPIPSDTRIIREEDDFRKEIMCAVIQAQGRYRATNDPKAIGPGGTQKSWAENIIHDTELLFCYALTGDRSITESDK